MKKLLSFSIIALFVCNVNAQHNVTPSIRTGAAGPKTFKDAGTVMNQAGISKTLRKTRGPFPSALGTKENTALTSYDLQTNGSMPRRILTAGSNISVSWTYSNEVAPTATSLYNDRGTGYSHFNGAVWSAPPAARIEPLRTGFGHMHFDGAGNEVTICHDANNALQMNKKVAGTWTTSQLSTSVVNQAIWPHTAASGNWLYVISSPADSNIKSNGIRNGYFFSRSNDNGATWVDNMIPMPLVDSVGHYRGGGNSYAISAQGSNVAVLFGDIGTDLTLVSSTDNGATWTKKVIWDWPMDNYDFASATITDINADNIVDTLESNDGSESMVMDANGDIHVAFPVVRVYKTGANTGYNFFYTTALVYYNTIADSITVVDNIFNIHHDCDGDNIFGIGENYVGSAAATPGAIYNTIGTITMPSISIVSGAPQKVLIAYTAIMDNDTTVDDGIHLFWGGATLYEGQNFRDVFVAVSPDNGATWNPHPVNISKTAHFEEAFVSTPEIVSGTDFHVLYQGDIEPGTIMQNEDGYDDVYRNLVIVQSVPVAQLLTLSIDSTSPCGQMDLPLGTKDIVNDNIGIISVYPNPADDYINLGMKFLTTSNKVDIQIVDLSGKRVSGKTLYNVNEETTRLETKSLAKGLYVIKITNDKGTTVRRFVKD